MKSFANCAAQGDLLIRRIEALPANISPADAIEGKYIVAHSETGHHHVIASRPNVIVYNTNDPLVSYLAVIEATDEAEVVLEHLRYYDKHEALIVPPGIFELRRQREYTPQGWQRVAD